MAVRRVHDLRHERRALADKPLHVLQFAVEGRLEERLRDAGRLLAPPAILLGLLPPGGLLLSLVLDLGEPGLRLIGIG